MTDYTCELTSEEEDIVDNLLHLSHGDMELLTKAIQLNTITVNGEDHVDIDAVEKTVIHQINDREFDLSIETAIESATKNWA